MLNNIATKIKRPCSQTCKFDQDLAFPLEDNKAGPDASTLITQGEPMTNKRAFRKARRGCEYCVQ